MRVQRSLASAPFSKDTVRDRLVAAWSRTIADVGRGAFADRIGVCTETVGNALSGKSMPELHTVLNSLIACLNALDEVLSLYGFRIVPNDAELSPDMRTLSESLDAINCFAAALEDGKRDHRETLELADKLRPVVPKLTAIVEEGDALRRPRSVKG